MKIREEETGEENGCRKRMRIRGDDYEGEKRRNRIIQIVMREGKEGGFVGKGKKERQRKKC